MEGGSNSLLNRTITQCDENKTPSEVSVEKNAALSKLRKRLLKEENFPEYFRNLVSRSGLVRLA